MNVIVFATTNQGKLVSLRKTLNEAGQGSIDIDACSLDIIEPQADDCEAVALSKARQAYALLKKPVLVDNSSFHIAALGGFPGVYAKYMNETLGARGIIDFMRGKADRSAYFNGALVYVDADGSEYIFREAPYYGTIAETVRTMDEQTAWSELHKIFIPTGGSKVLGEMSSDDFANVNRGQSKYEKFAQWLRDNG